MFATGQGKGQRYHMNSRRRLPVADVDICCGPDLNMQCHPHAVYMAA